MIKVVSLDNKPNEVELEGSCELVIAEITYALRVLLDGAKKAATAEIAQELYDIFVDAITCEEFCEVAGVKPYVGGV